MRTLPGDGLIRSRCTPPRRLRDLRCVPRQTLQRETLEITYKGHTISDVLDMTVEERRPFPASAGAGAQTRHADGCRLGYIKLARVRPRFGRRSPARELSRELSKRDTGRTLYILDEPTTGLHFHDIGSC